MGRYCIRVVYGSSMNETVPNRIGSFRYFHYALTSRNWLVESFIMEYHRTNTHQLFSYTFAHTVIVVGSTRILVMHHHRLFDIAFGFAAWFTLADSSHYQLSLLEGLTFFSGASVSGTVTHLLIDENGKECEDDPHRPDPCPVTPDCST
jgi:hypothetical protein